MADVSKIIEYYVNLLIIQYNNKPKARAMIDALVTQALSSGIYFDVRDAYNVDTAVGAQLDVIGKYVNLDRYFYGQDFTGFFALTPYGEVLPNAAKRGFVLQADFNTKEGETLSFNSVIASGQRLNDDDYRFLIKLRIIQNNSNHSHKEIDDAIFNAFGTDVRPDSDGNMVMYYFVDPSRVEIAKVAYQKGVFPKPLGVRLNYLIEQDKPFFGFYSGGGSSAYTTGFSTYADYGTKVGETINYDKLMLP